MFFFDVSMFAGKLKSKTDRLFRTFLFDLCSIWVFFYRPSPNLKNKINCQQRSLPSAVRRQGRRKLKSKCSAAISSAGERSWAGEVALVETFGPTHQIETKSPKNRSCFFFAFCVHPPLSYLHRVMVLRPGVVGEGKDKGGGGELPAARRVGGQDRHW